MCKKKNWSKNQGSHAGLPQTSSVALDALLALFCKGKGVNSLNVSFQC